MNARELTTKMFEHDNIIYDYQKRIEVLEQETAKLRLLIEDMQIDVKMMQKKERYK